MILKKPLWVLLLGLTGVCWGNVNVYFSAGAPASTQATFLANTTNQCDYSYFSPNTFPDSYDLILSSCAAAAASGTISQLDLLNAIVTVDSYTFVYGWASGQEYERTTDIQYMSNFLTDCFQASTSTFLVEGSTSVYQTNIDTTTCVNAVSTVENFIYSLNFSSPTVVPGF